MKIDQVYGYNSFSEEKVTSDSEYRIKFLNSLPVGSTVYRETEEYDPRYGWLMVITPIGEVAEGLFGDNVFKKY